MKMTLLALTMALLCKGTFFVIDEELEREHEVGRKITLSRGEVHEFIQEETMSFNSSRVKTS